MSKQKRPQSLSWDEFRELGNPEDSAQADLKDESSDAPLNKQDRIRIYLQKKGRAGKKVSMIKGLTLPPDQLKVLCKSLKSTCGVGGKIEDDEIMLQGDQRKRLLTEFLSMGYRDVKIAG